MLEPGDAQKCLVALKTEITERAIDEVLATQAGLAANAEDAPDNADATTWVSRETETACIKRMI
jgi:hypothetical protein